MCSSSTAHPLIMLQPISLSCLNSWQSLGTGTDGHQLEVRTHTHKGCWAISAYTCYLQYNLCTLSNSRNTWWAPLQTVPSGVYGLLTSLIKHQTSQTLWPSLTRESVSLPVCFSLSSPSSWCSVSSLGSEEPSEMIHLGDFSSLLEPNSFLQRLAASCMYTVVKERERERGGEKNVYICTYIYFLPQITGNSCNCIQLQHANLIDVQ